MILAQSIDVWYRKNLACRSVSFGVSECRLRGILSGAARPLRQSIPQNLTMFRFDGASAFGCSAFKPPDDFIIQVSDNKLRHDDAPSLSMIA